MSAPPAMVCVESTETFEAPETTVLIAPTTDWFPFAPALIACTWTIPDCVAPTAIDVAARVM